jgi:DNA-binding MurR/RpiR family transcriptional regulator
MTPAAPSASTRSFLHRVRTHLATLSPTERRLAEAILEFPGEIASYTASELAAYANVSNATVTRFVKRLGYSGYEDARRHVRADKGAGAALLLMPATRVEDADALEMHARQGVANLNATLKRLTSADMVNIAQTILNARKVWLAGYRVNQTFASYCRWQLMQVLDHVSVIPGAGDTLAEHLINIRAEDCVIVFGLRRSVPLAREIVSHANEVGARTVYVTNAQATGEVKANWVVRCDTAAPGPLDNHVAVMAFCHLLTSAVLEQSGTAGRRRLSAIEILHETLGEL